MYPHFSSYLDDIPSEIIPPFRAFANKFRLVITRELSIHGSLSLTQIQNRTGKGTGYIIHNLKQLEMAGLVQNFLQTREDTREYSYYDLTRLCKALIKAILTSISPRVTGSDTATEFTPSSNEADLERIEGLFKSLGNRFRIALVHYLQDRTSLSFSEIVAITHQEKNAISAHLKKLEISGIVQNFLRREKDSVEYSFYELTRFGRDLLDSLHKAYNTVASPGAATTLKRGLESGVPENGSVIEAVTTTWALPNEPIIGWIKVLSNNVDKISFELSSNLGIKNRDADLGITLDAAEANELAAMRNGADPVAPRKNVGKNPCNRC